MSKLYYVRFAQAYGEGVYGECNYNDTACTTTGGGTSGGSSPGPGGTLTDTGLMVALVVALACLLVFVALVVRFWRRPVRQEVPAEGVAPVQPGQGGSQPPHGPSLD